MKQDWLDPIVEEVRRFRRELAEESGCDLHAICERMRESERQHPELYVDLSRRRYPDGALGLDDGRVAED